MGDRAGLLLFSQVAHTARRPPRKVRPLEVHRSQRGKVGSVLSCRVFFAVWRDRLPELTGAAGATFPGEGPDAGSGAGMRPMSAARNAFSAALRNSVLRGNQDARPHCRAWNATRR